MNSSNSKSEISVSAHKPAAPKKEEFFERPFEEVEDGVYDERGFYITPNGSFWDEEETYFNREGFDKHGGRYDKYGLYLPGEGWNEEYNCYEEDIAGKEDEAVKGTIMSNLNDELVEAYDQNKELLEKGDNSDSDEVEDLSEKEMKEIFDDAVKFNETLAAKKRALESVSDGANAVSPKDNKILVAQKEENVAANN